MVDIPFLSVMIMLEIVTTWFLRCWKDEFVVLTNWIPILTPSRESRPKRIDTCGKLIFVLDLLLNNTVVFITAGMLMLLIWRSLKVMTLLNRHPQCSNDDRCIIQIRMEMLDKLNEDWML